MITTYLKLDDKRSIKVDLEASKSLMLYFTKQKLKEFLDSAGEFTDLDKEQTYIKTLLEGKGFTNIETKVIAL